MTPYASWFTIFPLRARSVTILAERCEPFLCEALKRGIPGLGEGVGSAKEQESEGYKRPHFYRFLISEYTTTFAVIDVKRKGGVVFAT